MKQLFYRVLAYFFGDYPDVYENELGEWYDSI